MTARVDRRGSFSWGDANVDVSNLERAEQVDRANKELLVNCVLNLIISISSRAQVSV